MKKIKNIMTLGLCVLMCLSVSGCGTELLTMTEEEEATVVNYAAHVISKYNKGQPDGISYVSQDKLEEKQAEEEKKAQETAESSAESQTDGSQTDGSQTGNAQTDGNQNGNETLPEKTLEEALMLEGFTIQRGAQEVADAYMESGAYSLTPDNGKQYLILHYTIMNPGTEDLECDILSHTPNFKITTSAGTVIPAETTILLNDFSTYQGTIAAGGSTDVVLLFQVDKDSLTAEDTVSLEVTVNGESSLIRQ